MAIISRVISESLPAAAACACNGDGVSCPCLHRKQHMHAVALSLSLSLVWTRSGSMSDGPHMNPIQSQSPRPARLHGNCYAHLHTSIRCYSVGHTDAAQPQPIGIQILLEPSWPGPALVKMASYGFYEKLFAPNLVISIFRLTYQRGTERKNIHYYSIQLFSDYTIITTRPGLAAILVDLHAHTYDQAGGYGRKKASSCYLLTFSSNGKRYNGQIDQSPNSDFRATWMSEQGQARSVRAMPTG